MAPREPPAETAAGSGAAEADGSAATGEDVFEDSDNGSELPEFPEVSGVPPPPPVAGEGEAVPVRRRRRVRFIEQGTQATDEWGRPDWTRFDLVSALKVLRSGTDSDVKRVLQRLHIRHYHQSADQMRELLQAAGLSERVLKMIEPVVKGCRVCRMWARPGQKAAAATRLTTRFNDVLQGACCSCSTWPSSTSSTRPLGGAPSAR